jgi:hypothetical protein
MVRASRISHQIQRIQRFDAPITSVAFLAGWAIILGLAGCQAWVSKEKKKDNHFTKETKRFKELLLDPDRPRLVGEVASALGMSAKNYDAFGLATELPGTGGVVKPGTQRDLILADMRVRDVEAPEAVLDAPWTALVKLRVYANPCDEKGEVLDVDVDSSTECLATDLTGGYVLESRLREMAYIEGNMRTSDDKALASGEVVMLPTSYTKTETTPLKGVLIGGGRLIAEQRLGLRINPEFRHVVITKAIEKSVNSRFFFQDSNKQMLVAEGKNDWYIVLATVPKYKHDPAHFISVILATGFAESPEEQQERLLGCKKLLAKRETAQRAAVELESIGNSEAKEVLVSALASSDPEIRFFAAYSLAYLDRKESIPVLMELARYEPAFRPLCLVGLGVNEDSMAREALEELLQEAEPELRYGAFLAIRQRNPTDITVSGEMIDQNFQFVQVPSAVPLTAVSLQKKKEVVLFGNSAAIQLRAPISPTPSLRITPVMGDQLKLTKRKISGEVNNSIVASDLVSVLRAMGTVQASYNDVVHSLESLSSSKALVTPVVMNPRPFAGREYIRKSQSDSNSPVDSKLEIITVDRASLEKPESSSMSWLSPASWWKPSKEAKKPIVSESSELNSLELTDEERALLNN